MFRPGLHKKSLIFYFVMIIHRRCIKKSIFFIFIMPRVSRAMRKQVAHTVRIKQPTVKMEEYSPLKCWRHQFLLVHPIHLFKMTRNAICDVNMAYPLFYKKAGHTMAMGAWMDRQAGPSRGQMPISARNNLLPKECTVQKAEHLALNKRQLRNNNDP